MLSKVEMNDDYINKIMLDKSDIFKLKHQDKLSEDKLYIVVIDQAGIYYGGIIKLVDNLYSIVGDTEFNRVYPTLDFKTGKIIAINSKE